MGDNSRVEDSPGKGLGLTVLCQSKSQVRPERSMGTMSGCSKGGSLLSKCCFILKDLKQGRNKAKLAFYKGHCGRAVKDKPGQGETRGRGSKR